MMASDKYYEHDRECAEWEVSTHGNRCSETRTDGHVALVELLEDTNRPVALRRLYRPL